MTEVSYYQPRTSAPGAFAIVIALHAAGITALALWKIDVIHKGPGTIIAYPVPDQVDPEPVPPEPVEPDPQPHTEQIFRPKTIVELPPLTPSQHVELTPIPLPPVQGPVVGPGVEPSPVPPARQEAARARGDVRALFSEDDYPAAALRRGDSGSVRARLTIGTNGRVTGCSVVASSGSASLDQATCKVLSARARFTPARDGNGDPVGDSYTTPPIKWQLIDGG